MQRQFAQFSCPQNIPNDIMFERHGDDSINYFIDPLQQFVMQGGLAPIEIDTPSTPQLVSQVKSVMHQSSATIQANPQHFLIQPGASLKIFLDAWKPWQTVPIIAQVSANSVGGRYQWNFENYLPIQGSTSSIGEARICPQGVDADVIIRTLGHLNRTPLGEFHVTHASRIIYESKIESIRPSLMFKNITTTTPIHFTIYIGE